MTVSWGKLFERAANRELSVEAIRTTLDDQRGGGGDGRSVYGDERPAHSDDERAEADDG